MLTKYYLILIANTLVSIVIFILSYFTILYLEILVVG